MDNLIEVVVTSIVIIRMLVAGYFQPPGKVLSWPMFSRGAYLEFELTSVSGQEVDVWSELPAHRPMLNGRELEHMLAYLTVKYGEINGVVQINGSNGLQTITIVSSHVVV